MKNFFLFNGDLAPRYGLQSICICRPIFMWWPWRKWELRAVYNEDLTDLHELSELFDNEKDAIAARDKAIASFLEQ